MPPGNPEVRAVREILQFGLVAAMAVAVGGFGGTEPVSWWIAQILILSLGLLLLAASAKHLSSAIQKIHWVPVVIVAWVAAQYTGSRYGKIGLDSHAIESQGLALLAAIVAFYVALQVGRERKTCRRLAISLVVLGLLEALYGLLQYLAGWQYIWNVPRRFYIGSATGTYINHNHFAGLLEMILPVALCLAFYYRQPFEPRSSRFSARESLLHLGRPQNLKCLLLVLAAAIIFLALAFSLSRMGMISTLVSFCVIAAVGSAGTYRRAGPVILVLALLITGIAAVVWVGVGPVVEHFEQLPQNETLMQGGEGRSALWRDTLHLIGEHPWMGVGLGCFEFAFTRVQSIRVTFVADHAHNDYLELAAELGLPAAVLLISVLFWLAWKILRASLRADSNFSRAIALGSLGGISALLCHSLADFNLYIPANALVFAVLLGMGYAMSFDSSGHARARRPGGDARETGRQRRSSRPSQMEEENEVQAGVSVSRSG